MYWSRTPAWPVESIAYEPPVRVGNPAAGAVRTQVASPDGLVRDEPVTNDAAQGAKIPATRSPAVAAAAGAALHAEAATSAAAVVVAAILRTCMGAVLPVVGRRPPRAPSGLSAL